MIKTEGNKKQYINNAKRYIRISFESLLNYSAKTSRHLKKWQTKEIEEEINSVIANLKAGNEQVAMRNLQETFNLVAIKLAKKFN